MKAWFYGLQPRERWILGVGLVATVLIVFWAFVLKPLQRQSQSLQTAVESKQRLLVDLAQLEGAQTPLSPGGSGVQGREQTLVVVIDTTAQQHGIALSRTRPNGPSGIDVTFQGASFDVLVAWLMTLHGTYAVDVESASFTSARIQGLVNGQLSLQRL
jgi:general secretion pathway protein M